MNAARDFTRGEVARDDLALGVVDLGLRVDLHAAHRVVDGRRHHDGVERSLIEVARHVGATEGVLARSLALLPGFKGGLELVGGHAHLAGEFVKRLALEAVGLLDVVVRGLQGLLHVGVEEEVGHAVLLLEDGGGDRIAGVELVVEAGAVLVDEDGAVAADGFGDHFTDLGHDGRVGLDFRHVDELSADLFGKDDAFTLGARMVRRGEALQAGHVLGDELVVGAEAAGRIDDGLGVDRVGAVLLALDLNARDLAVVGEDLRGFSVHAHVDLAVLGGRVERADDFRADEGAAGRTMGAGLGGAGEQADVTKVAAESEEPFDGGTRTRDERANEFGIVLPVTALHRVVVGDFKGVLNTLGGLERRARGVEAAGCADRVAARHGHLFNNDDLGAEVGRFDGGGKARAARADHGDVDGDVFSGLNAGNAEGGGHGRGKKNLLHFECSPMRLRRMACRQCLSPVVRRGWPAPELVENGA